MIGFFAIQYYAGADPGFPVGGGANSPRRGCQHTNLPDFSKNCMKLRKFLSGGDATAPPWIRHCYALLNVWNMKITRSTSTSVTEMDIK